MVFRLLIAASLLVMSLPAQAQPVGAGRGESMAWSIVDDIVQVTTTLPDGQAGEEGFGFVFGVADGPLYIATADHVVRGANDDPAAPVKIEVTFHNDQGHRYHAELLGVRLSQAQGDLAVLSVARPETYIPRWPPYADADALRPGTRAWRIGKLERWVPATGPGEFVGRSDTIWLAFDNLDTPRGSSGGPIVTEDGIVGMVVSDGGVSGAPSNVLPIGTIRSVLLGWQLPWDLPASGSISRLRARASADPSTAPSFSLPGLSTAPSDTPTPAPNNRPAEPSRSVFAAVDAGHLAAPASPPPGRSSAIRSFVARYYADVSRPDAIQFLRNDYARQVRYNGQSLTQEQVLSQQAASFQRWPLRDLAPQADSITSSCDASGQQCHVEGVVDYELHNLQRAAVSTGLERFVMDLDFSLSSPVIVALQSVGLQRNAASSAAPSDHWTTRPPGECARHYYTWDTRGELFEFTDEAGELDIERVIARSAGTVTTETVSSTRRTAAIGTRWVYVFDPGGSVRVRNLASGAGFTLNRCGRP